MDSDELSRGNFEVGFRPQQSVKAGRERQPEAQLRGGGPARGGEAESRPPQPPERGLAVSPAPPGALSCSPGWCSAFYEADCFGPDVHSYVQELAGQKASGDPAANAQSPVSPASAGGEGARPRPALLSAWRWRGSARACPSLEDGARPGACLGLSGGRVLGPALISAWWRVGGTGLSPAPVSAWGRGQGSAPRAAGKEDALRARRTCPSQGSQFPPVPAATMLGRAPTVCPPRGLVFMCVHPPSRGQEAASLFWALGHQGPAGRRSPCPGDHSWVWAAGSA